MPAPSPAKPSDLFFFWSGGGVKSVALQPVSTRGGSVLFDTRQQPHLTPFTFRGVGVPFAFEGVGLATLWPMVWLPSTTYLTPDGRKAPRQATGGVRVGPHSSPLQCSPWRGVCSG